MLTFAVNICLRIAGPMQKDYAEFMQGIYAKDYAGFMKRIYAGFIISGSPVSLTTTHQMYEVQRV